MAVATISTLLATLKDSITSASSALPDAGALDPQPVGVSLLDTKNELLLAYLHNLVFFIILKLRSTTPADKDASHHALGEDVTKKLVELRVYLEKGVRPLEGKLKYQLDKLVARVHEADGMASMNDKGGIKEAQNGHARQCDASEEEDDDEDDTDVVKATALAQVSDLSHRPNPSAFARPSSASHNARQENSGIYKPPRITPTALPTTDRAARQSTRPRKSATVDAFIREELNDAPVAESSIGAGSGLRGKERQREEERRAYEEQKLVRLPAEKKKRRR
ncbi:MAG: hypothetical protein Q9163_002315, partial [Psora crenata]